MEHVRVHDLRHSYASWLASDPNISLTTIRDMLRHSSLSMTNRYAHLNDKVKRQAAEDLGTQVKKMTQLVGSNSNVAQDEKPSNTKKP